MTARSCRALLSRLKCKGQSRSFSGRRPLLVALLVMLATALHVHAQRLPADVVPEHYALHFTPDLAAERFAGEANIRVSVLNPTTRIVLHAVDLEIMTATVSAGSGVHPAQVNADAGAQTVELYLRDRLSSGPAEIRLTQDRYRALLVRQGPDAIPCGVGRCASKVSRTLGKEARRHVGVIDGQAVLKRLFRGLPARRAVVRQAFLISIAQ